MPEPLCDKCKKNPACVHIRTMTQDGKPGATLNLCAICALEEIKSNDKSGILGKLLRDTAPEEMLEQLAQLAGKLEAQGNPQVKPADAPAAPAPDKKGEPTCPHCNATMAKVLNGRVIPCRQCFETFAETLKNGVENRGDITMPDKSQRHLQSATPMPELLKLLEDRDDLQQQLDKAVDREDYRLAAQIKDKLAQVSEKIPKLSRESQEAQSGEGRAAADGSAARHPRIQRRYPVWLPRPTSAAPQIILNSFCSFSRNLKGHALPPFTGERKGCDRKVVQNLLDRLGATSVFGNAVIMKDVYSPSYQRMLELGRLLCLPPHVQTTPPRQIVALSSRTMSATALINWLDHLRVTIWGEGSRLAQTIQNAQQLSQQLLPESSYERFGKYGALSRDLFCNGVDFTFGVYLFLPILTISGELPALYRACSELGVFMNPVDELPGEQNLGQGIVKLSAAVMNGGGAYRASRQLMQVARLLRDRELLMRNCMLGNYFLRSKLRDDLGRAAGVVRFARRLHVGEANDLLCKLWVGHELGAFPEVTKDHVFRIFAALPPEPDDNEKGYTERSWKTEELLSRLFRTVFAGENDDDGDGDDDAINP